MDDTAAHDTIGSCSWIKGFETPDKGMLGFLCSLWLQGLAIKMLAFETPYSGQFIFIYKGPPLPPFCSSTMEYPLKKYCGVDWYPFVPKEENSMLIPFMLWKLW